MPVTKKSSFISKETNPGCGIGHEKVIAISSSPATHRLRTFYKHTAKEEKGKKKEKKIDMDSEKSQLGFASSNRKKKVTFFAKYIAGCKHFLPALHIYILKGFS